MANNYAQNRNVDFQETLTHMNKEFGIGHKQLLQFTLNTNYQNSLNKVQYIIL